MNNITSHLKLVGLIISFVLVAGSTAAYGQGSRRQVADIPFQFQVGNETLPAGQYSVAATSTGETLRISSRATNATIFRLSSPLVRLETASKEHEPRLVNAHPTRQWHRRCLTDWGRECAPREVTRSVRCILAARVQGDPRSCWLHVRSE